ncbi:MAG: Mur ligase family protein [Flavobacteriaceae bacterium]|nr:Mur ligase family protein [Flavobacteriaceae bacterium]MDG2415756.1 Mur ligase family protein [Flavobacteriaceae bacterium]
MRIHFIAIGGSAMHNLALALHEAGHEISGSDDVIFEPSRSRLEVVGLLPLKMGWQPENIHSGIDVIILGMHAKPGNPELAKAQELGLKVSSYPEFLYEHSKHKTRVVIGGSHGKTTITSMILHVMHYHEKDIDFMVGAQLEGFDKMVHLTEENDFMLLEGDEYLSSPIDPQSKFLHYKPHIALLSGIAWDHINVFPTFESYCAPFESFIDSIVAGGSLSYNQEDALLHEMVEKATNTIRKIAYTTPEATIDNGLTYLETEEGPLPLEIFGKHNLNNLAGAKWVCQHMGIDALDFYEAISSFKGASKRLELIAKNNKTAIYKDFAHAPSKVKATTAAVKEQYPDRKLVVVLELHTYSSLNVSFLKEYKNALAKADVGMVFYEPAVLAIKDRDPISAEVIKEAFGSNTLQIETTTDGLAVFLRDLPLEETVLLFMSSGNYGGTDFKALAQRVS